MTEKTNQNNQKRSETGQVVIISEITAEIPEVNLLCKVLTFNSKGYEKNGRVGTRYYGLVEDPSGTIPFSAWRNPGIARNDVVLISNATVRQWQDVLSLSIGTKTNVKRITNKDEIEKFEKDTQVHSTRKLQMAQLRPGLINISVNCRVISVEPLEVKVKGEPMTVYKGVLADQTGCLRFTAWKDFELEPDSVIEVFGASVKAWNGYLEMALNASSNVNKRSDDHLPPSKELPVEKIIPISALYDEDYLTTPEFILQGTVLDFRNGSGLINRCSQCSRAVAGLECQVHGKVELKHDLRLKVVLDDGSGAVTVFLGNELSEQFLGISLKDCLKNVSSGSDPGTYNEELLSSHILREIQVKGTVFRDDFGISIQATSLKTIEFQEETIRAEAQAILNEMEL